MWQRPRQVRSSRKSPLGARTVLANAGIFVLDPELLSYMPPGQQLYPLPRLIEKALDRRSVAEKYVIDIRWIEVENPEDYEHVHRGLVGEAR